MCGGPSWEDLERAAAERELERARAREAWEAEQRRQAWRRTMDDLRRLREHEKVVVTTPDDDRVLISA